MMRDKQDEHPCSRPFVRCIAPELISHQEKKRRRHRQVNHYLQSRLRFHRLSSILLFLSSDYICKLRTSKILVDYRLSYRKRIEGHRGHWDQSVSLRFFRLLKSSQHSMGKISRSPAGRSLRHALCRRSRELPSARW